VADTTPNPLAKDLVDSSGNPKPYVVLSGYLWKASDKDKTVRLYTSLEFHSYYEIQVADILHTTRPDLQYEEMPAKVYVDAAAQVSLVRRGTAGTVKPVGQAAQGGEVSYLKGGISSVHLADALRTVAEGLCVALGSVLHCSPTTGPACSALACAARGATGGVKGYGSVIAACATTKGLACSVFTCSPECETKCEDK
jgi:hypothetical protein